MNDPIINQYQAAIKANQMAMARNIASLATKGAQKQQAHLLCVSLKQSIRAAS